MCWTTNMRMWSQKHIMDLFVSNGRTEENVSVHGMKISPYLERSKRVSKTQAAGSSEDDDVLRHRSLRAQCRPFTYTLALRNRTRRSSARIAVHAHASFTQMVFFLILFRLRCYVENESVWWPLIWIPEVEVSCCR